MPIPAVYCEYSAASDDTAVFRYAPLFAYGLIGRAFDAYVH